MELCEGLIPNQKTGPAKAGQFPRRVRLVWRVARKRQAINCGG